MTHARTLVARFWESLDERVRTDAAFGAKGDGVPSGRLRKALFPLIFSNSRNSGRLVDCRGDFQKEEEEEVVREFNDQIGTLAVAMEWYWTLSSHELRKLCGQAGITWVHQGDSQTRRFAFAYWLATKDKRFSTTEEKVEYAFDEIKSRTEAEAKLSADAIDVYILEHGAELEQELDRVWTNATVNSPGGNLDDVARARLDSLIAHFDYDERRKMGKIEDIEATDEIWKSLIESELGTAGVLPRALGLTAYNEVSKPGLTESQVHSEADLQKSTLSTLPLDQPIRSRITRLLRGAAGEVNKSPGEVLQTAIECSGQPLGLGDAPSRIALLLGSRLSEFLIRGHLPRDASKAATAIRAEWLRGGSVASAANNNGPLTEKARTFIDEPQSYFLLRLWGRLFRRNINGEALKGPKDAWQEILSAVYSTRQHVRNLSPNKTLVQMLVHAPAQADQTDVVYVEMERAMNTVNPVRASAENIRKILDHAFEVQDDADAFTFRAARYSSKIDPDYARDEKRWGVWAKGWAAENGLLDNEVLAFAEVVELLSELMNRRED